MSMPLAGLPFSDTIVKDIVYVAAGLVVLGVCVVASRVLAHRIAQSLHNQNLPVSLVVLVRRGVYVVIIGIGVFAAFALAFETANVALVGILLATVVAALGVQQLLQDYVSGYYVLVERHVRIGERIKVADIVGTVVEIKLRVTLIRTDAGDLAVLPNSALFGQPVVIYQKQVEAAAKPAPPG
jgi:small-conductance mechanosensitive channel